MNEPTPQPESSDDAVAIIGGGIAGLTAARALAREGVNVELFDKGRGVGGRLSTRRTDDGRRFDHGAQYFTAEDDRFGEQVNRWLATGAAAEWSGRIATYRCEADACAPEDAPAPKTRYVGTPGMSALAAALQAEATASGARVHTGLRVASLKSVDHRWRLTAAATGESLGEFARVLVTAPAPQAADLLTASPSLANAAKSVRMTGCWAAMAAFDEPVDARFDGAFVNGCADATPLSWVARDSSKPGRQDAAGDDETWVLHGSPEWSEANLDATADAVLEALLHGFERVVGAATPRPAFVQAHRWRFATPVTPLADRALADPARGLFAAGDWCGGSRVEGAYLSGVAAAEALLAE